MDSPRDLFYLGTISVLGFSATFLFLFYGWARIRAVIQREEDRLDRVLNNQLLLDIPPRAALGLILLAVLGVGAVMWAVLQSFFWFIMGAAGALFLPYLVISHLEEKRRKRLDEQIVDGMVTLSSGVRAGLNLVQSIQLLVKNSVGPIQQEFRQLLREYELGVDLNLAMRNTSDRIGSSYYRLLFTAIQAHRDRGGDMGQSLDRISESVREIQRLEGKLDAITAQGRAQARFMAAMPVVILVILWVIAPDDTEKLLIEPIGRLILLVATVLIVTGFLWIQRIMQVDI
ncbi:MAG: type II secretion system F family protein [Phycisphaerae bacterium]|nr:type II secretion system F family protein [Phycisphaerae bacterium]